MSRHGKILVAMSGGVDSSVSACLLKEQGYDCVGVFMCVGVGHAATRARQAETDGQASFRHGCCSPQDQSDARQICGRLGIPFHVLNLQADFERIIEYFVDEYAQARTPNPCVMCNTHVKFGRLMAEADRIGADFVATGHYARIVNRWEGGDSPALARSLNLAKDQSYVLFGIRREILARCVFPVGEIADKTRVRAIAADLGLRVHDKPDSQEICFVPNDDYKELVAARRPATQRPGRIVDESGHVLGTHNGVANFTIGQRRGLGIATGEPIYVTRLNVVENEVVIGDRGALLADTLVAEHVNWLVSPPPAGEWRPAQVKIRYQHEPAPAMLCRQLDESVAVRFEQPQSAITPGQAAVFYAGEITLGGGWIRGSTPDK